MRVKTSITLPEDLLRRIDRVDANRSALLARAAVADLARLEHQERDRKDLEIINRHAERLNRQAKDTLEYQQILRPRDLTARRTGAPPHRSAPHPVK